MGANFSPDDKDWVFSSLKQGRFTKSEISTILTGFDKQTDFDVKMIEQIKKETAHLKRVCFYKLLICPIELPLILLIFGEKDVKMRFKELKLYTRLLLGKVSYNQFNILLLDSLKEKKAIT